MLRRSKAANWGFQGNGEAVVISDREGKGLYFTPEAQRILGAGPKDVGKESWPLAYGCFLPDTVTPFPHERLPLVRALRGESVDQEILYIRNEGRPGGAWLNLTARPLHDSKGDIQGAVVAIAEASDHMTSTGKVTAMMSGGSAPMSVSPDGASALPWVQGLLTRYEMINSAVEQTSDSVVITNRDGIIQYVNRGFTQTTGFTREDAVGRSARILKSGKHPPAFYRELWETILSGQTYRGIIINRKRSGEYYSAQQSISPIVDENGAITHFVSVLRDITDLLQSQEHEFQMRVAREIQCRLYGAATFIPGFDIEGTTVQAQQVGGDYFDFIPMEGDCLGIVVADATGHGIGPALVMAETRAYLHTMVSQCGDLGQILTRMNVALHRDLPNNRFVTLFMACLNPKTRTLVYANAGHIPGLLVDERGIPKPRLRSLGPPLGILEGTEYGVSEPIRLDAGDVLLLMTDGLMETQNRSGEEFGMDKAELFLSERCKDPARVILDGLREAVRVFEHDEQLRDDVTAVVVKVLPDEAQPG